MGKNLENKTPPDDQFSEAETVGRREAALKRMLSTPPTPHTKAAQKSREAKLSKPKART
jgi:hypothetical protein